MGDGSLFIVKLGLKLDSFSLTLDTLMCEMCGQQRRKVWRQGNPEAKTGGGAVEPLWE